MRKDLLTGTRQPETQPLSQRWKIAFLFVAYLAVTTVIWLLLPDHYLPEISLLTMLQFWGVISLAGLGGLVTLWAGGALVRAVTQPLKAKNSEKLKQEPVRQLYRSNGERLDITEDEGQSLPQQKEKRL